MKVSFSTSLVNQLEEDLGGRTSKGLTSGLEDGGVRILAASLLGGRTSKDLTSELWRGLYQEGPGGPQGIGGKPIHS